MHDVVASFNRSVQGLLDFLLDATELFRNQSPGVIQGKQDARHVNAPLAAEVTEIETADHLVGDEERVGISQYAYCISQVEREAFELVRNFNIFLGHEVLAPQPNHF